MTRDQTRAIARPERPYGVVLASATTAAAAAGFSFYESLHQHGSGSLPWAICAAASITAAAASTHHAHKRWRQMRRQPTLRQSTVPPSPRQSGAVSSSSLAFPTRVKLLALPAPPGMTFKAEEPDKQAATSLNAAEAPIDGKRERLREGYPDAGGSNIPIGQPTGALGGKSFGSGVATGPVSNLDAILTYARHLVPGFKTDLGHMFDREADRATRVSGALGLAVKITALGIIGYYLYIESIEFRARAMKTWAEACISRQQNAINHTSVADLLSNKKLDGDADCASP